jgi:two-component system capsular synthesis sensor histidine kinase RcsC
MLNVAHEPRMVPPPGAGAGRLVLLVDDHEPSLSTLRQVVESAGYDCFATHSASEALVFCDSSCPGVVVTDLAMPRLDGKCLARWLKARYPALPILLTTGEMLDDRTKSDLCGIFSAVLTKPLQVQSLLYHLDLLVPPACDGPRA